MALNRDKFRKIVGGITTAEPEEAAESDTVPPTATPHKPENLPQPTAGQGSAPAGDKDSAEAVPVADYRRFAKRGRPKGRKDNAPASKARKVKVSLFLSEDLVNDIYDWAHEDRIHPGEMFERALKPFHEKEAKRRNAGKE
jgi:hypothetical protein